MTSFILGALFGVMVMIAFEIAEDIWDRHRG